MQTYSTRGRLSNPRRPKAAFALGLEPGTSLLRTWAEGPLTCELVYDAAASEREPGNYPYRVYLAGPGHLSTESFATPGGVDAYVRRVIDCLEFEAFVAEETEREQAVARAMKARRPYTFEPSATDREWWAEESLGRLAPVCGGGPEPELLVAGHWFMPGEDDDLYPVERTSDDLPSGGFLGHEA